MSGSKLKIDLRRNKILEILRANGKVYVTELSDILNASAVTIRTDLSALEKDGQLIRMSGGAVLPIHKTSDCNVFPKSIQNLKQKQIIADAVVDLIQDGNTLFINSGTTTQIISEVLKTRKNLNIVTNSLAVAVNLGSVPTFRVILLGGEINSLYGFTYGADTQDQLNLYRADWAILSIDGFSDQGKITTYHTEEAVIDRTMMQRSGKVLIAADSSKIGRTGFSFVSDCDSKVQLVTDCSADVADAIKEKGVAVINV